MGVVRVAVPQTLCLHDVMSLTMVHRHRCCNRLQFLEHSEARVGVHPIQHTPKLDFLMMQCRNTEHMTLCLCCNLVDTIIGVFCLGSRGASASESGAIKAGSGFAQDSCRLPLVSNMLLYIQNVWRNFPKVKIVAVIILRSERVDCVSCTNCISRTGAIPGKILRSYL